jgi:hypothetical protein
LSVSEEEKKENERYFGTDVTKQKEEKEHKKKGRKKYTVI